MNGKIANPSKILLIEDNSGDAELAIEAFQEGLFCSQLNVVSDGEAALAFLRRKGKYRNAPRPHLILLDLNLPKMNGREVLAEIKTDPDLRRIPVVVFSSSSSQEDILESYNLHANCYITKPVNFEQFIEIVRALESFWLTLVKLPSE